MSSSKVTVTPWPLTATWFPEGTLFLELLSFLFICIQLWDWPPLLPSHTATGSYSVLSAFGMDKHTSLEDPPEASAGSAWCCPSAWRRRARRASNTCAPRFALATSSLRWHSRCSPEGPWNCCFGACLLPLHTITAGACWSAKNSPKQGVKVRAFLRNSLPLLVWQSRLLCSGTQWKSHLFS